MYKKLLKYDFKGVAKVGLPLTIVALILSVIGAISGFIFARNMSGDDVSGFSIMSILLFVIIAYAVIICCALVNILVYVDFYKSLCTDQAYLTFTLPVKSTTLLYSKLTNSVIWGAISLAAMAVCIIIMVLGVGLGLPPGGSSGGEAIDSFLSFYDIADTTLGIITLLVYAINTQMLVFMVIFFASIITKKNKAVVAVSLVFAVSLVYSLVYSLIGAIISAATSSAGNAGSIITSVISIILLVGSGIGYFFLTKYMMEKKLNLA